MPLAMLLFAAAVTVEAGPTQVVDRAEVIASAQDTIPAGSESWKPVALPHNWYGDRVLTAPRVWYRMQVTGDAPDVSHSIFMSRFWVEEIEVYVNGKRIWRTPYEWPPNGAPLAAVLAVIEPGLLRAGTNTIHLRVNANPASFHGVPRIEFGDTFTLRKKTMASRALQYHGIVWSMRVLGVIGLVALLSWLFARRDPVLFWYGLIGFSSFVLCELWYDAFFSGGTTLWQNALSAVRFNGYLLPMLVMNLRLAGRRCSGYETAIWVIFLGALASVAFPHEWYETAVIASAFVFLSISVLSVLVVLSAPNALRHPAMLLLIAGNVLAGLLYLHEPGMQLGWIPIDRPRLSVYAPVAILLAALVPIMVKFLALSRTAGRRAEETHARLWKAEQEQALAELRRRIMADMHDGLGARLVALLSMAQSGKADPKVLSEGIAAALDELRLAIDAVEPVEGDVNVVLGSVRHRMRSVLEHAGVHLVWNASELPAIQDLTPQRILAIQRILLEVFTNIIKHSGARSVSVSTVRLPNAVEIAIEDDGRGFSSEAQNGGHGLGNLQMRSVEAGCTVKVVSQIDKGTRVAITLLADDETMADGGTRTAAKSDDAYPILGVTEQRSSA